MSETVSSTNQSTTIVVRLRNRAALRTLMGLLVLLSVFDYPIFYVGAGDIGIFDLYLVFAFFVYLVFFRQTLPPRSWQAYFLFFAAYIMYMTLHLVLFVTTFSYLVILKTCETLVELFLLVGYLHDPDTDHAGFSRLAKAIMVAMAVFQLMSHFNLTRFIGFPPGFGFGSWYRVGIPFSRGDSSSNPAGFVLATYLLVVLRDIVAHKRRSDFAVFGLLFLSLLLTVSRTNLIAFFVTLIIWAVLRAARRKNGLRIIVIVAASVALLFVILVNAVPEGSGLWLFVKIIENPANILSDGSFSIRYTIAWPASIQNWLRNETTFLFGNGVGYMGIVDGTVPRLLGNQGLIGLILFSMTWYGFYVKKYRRNTILMMVLLLALINGITADTLISSYRSVQVFVVTLCLALFVDPLGRRDPDFGGGPTRSSTGQSP